MSHTSAILFGFVFLLCSNVDARKKKESEPQVSVRGKVIKVSDGDTFHLRPGSGDKVKVRLQGVDCPEKDQPWGNEARDALRGMILNQEATVIVETTDRYGRSVGTAYDKQGRNVNQALVAEGNCWWYQEYAPHDTTLERLESTARTARKGLWSATNPKAPWEHRKENRDKRKTGHR